MSDQMNAAQVKELYDKGEIVLIDVREADEYAEKHIEGAKHLPMSSFNPHDVPAVEEGKTLVFQCLVGGRSGRMMDVYSAFFPDVKCYNFDGGIAAWEEAGYPLVKG
jgi:rhodanese-related sulfurtransferase